MAEIMGEKGGHSGAPMRKRLSELADATTDRRDRYVDFLRAFSITVVILGHWLGAVVEWHGGQITGASALDLVPGLWIITWALQVIAGLLLCRRILQHGHLQRGTST